MPLLGIALAGSPLAPFLAFPPLTANRAQPGFSRAVFAGLAGFVLLMTLPIALGIRDRARRAPAPQRRRRFTLPAWGWLGAAIVGAFWVLAWPRLPWFSKQQDHTFFPLWLGYILVVNALTLVRTGHCLLTHRPGYLLVLFPASAVFWWLFEYLNRFVGNWHYVGVEHYGAAEYVAFASLSFSTVLPAVTSTTEWLGSFRGLDEGSRRLWEVTVARPGLMAGAVLAASAGALAAVGVWPGVMFPLVWVAPVGVLLPLQYLLTGRTSLWPLGTGDWRPIVLPASAALICGFFWELWNYGSQAHWEYVIPYVDRFRLFAMPILGYAGYVPFGITCRAVTELLPRPGGRA